MSTATVANKKDFFTKFKELVFEGKKYLLTALLAGILSGSIILIGFYFKTNYTLPQLEQKVKAIETDVEAIKKDALGPTVDGKLNSQRLDDIQRQVNEVKDDIKSVKTDVKSVSDKIDKNQQQVIEILKTK